MQALAQEQEEMIAAARKEQAAILREAAQTRDRIVGDAQAAAKDEADRILAQARLEIAAEKESALRDVRKEVALLGVEVAEKVLRQQLSVEGDQQMFIDRLVDEAMKTTLPS